MSDGSANELQRSTLELFDRIERGEVVEITGGGGRLSVHRPAGTRPRFIARETFVLDVLAHRADAGLRDDLRDLGLGSTLDDPRSP